MTPESASLLAGYNRTMNERMYTAAARLDEAALATDRGAFFGSILGTLNHIAVADTIWLHRFASHSTDFTALAGLAAFARPSSLRQPLAPDLARLRPYREQLDELILSWVAQLVPGHLAAPFSYASMAGTRFRKNFAGVLQHFFNHQTHHRGQVSTLLFQCGVDVGVTDLLLSVPENPA